MKKALGKNIKKEEPSENIELSRRLEAKLKLQKSFERYGEIAPYN